ncbi:MAG TPA: hypothetical protein DEA08_02650 [Planctomycetes bacterium]|nr:hypothetical protein [Planctomycetota bacterium]
MSEEKPDPAETEGPTTESQSPTTEPETESPTTEPESPTTEPERPTTEAEPETETERPTTEAEPETETESPTTEPETEIAHEAGGPSAGVKAKDSDEGWIQMVALAAVIGIAALLIHAYRARQANPGPSPRATSTRGGDGGGSREEATKRLGVYLETKDGFLVVLRTLSGGAAEAAGVRAGDRILAIDQRAIEVSAGDPIASAAPIFARLAALRPGEGVRLQIQRQREEGYGDPEWVPVTFAQGKGFELGLARELISTGVAQLVSAQRSDGWWSHYHVPLPPEGPRPSVAVSALVAYALRRAEPQLGELERARLGDLLDRLVASRAPDGGVVDPEHGVQHRVYASALTLLALHDAAGKVAERHRAAAGELRAWLAEVQVAEQHGIGVVDRRYGGWSYRDDYGPTLRTDVSTARFALQALADAGLPADAPAWERAGAFLDLVQNHSLLSAPDDPQRKRERPLRDGGFSFTPLTSKAGRAILDGIVVGRSYGSATADGLIGLLAVRGLDRRRSDKRRGPRDPSVLAALSWLARHFSVSENPGFEPDPTGWKDGLYFYYVASLSQALHRAGVWSIEQEGKARVWARELVTTLGFRHGQRGRSFGSDSGLMHEDLPAIAASFAVLALADARDRLELGDGVRLKDEAPPPALAVVEPAPPPPADAYERAKRLYQIACSSCHATGGTNGPVLDGVGAVYLSEHGSRKRAGQRLRAFLQDPLNEPALLGWGKQNERTMARPALNDQQLDDLVAYLLDR